MSRREAPIVGLRAAAYRVPTEAPEADGTLEWDATTMVTVHVEAGGATGFGYSYASRAAAVLAVELLVPVLEGQEALDTAARWRDMIDALRNQGRMGLAACAVSACDAALHDLRGKLLGAPLADLLGRRRDRAPLYASGGFTNWVDDRLRDWTDEMREAGFEAIKIKVGAEIGREAARLATARQAAGETALMADANGACDRKGALRLAECLADHGAVWFEEPVSSDDLDGLRLLRDRGPAGLEIAAGEYAYDAWGFRRLLEAGAVDVLQADATRCCGITGLMQADALAWAHGVPLSIHCAPALHLQPALCLQRLRHVEWFHDHARLEAMLLDGAPEPESGMAAPDPGRPGLGLELREADAEHFSVWQGRAA
ncbi:enolase C-terminal domain-like protein [Jannaschia formosa]|uniref:enolase C-terminal domain-like protein n=1 Tax=Jannaschia formosa TaxID=2259592 RepID=UPI000E1C23A4|nr:enolase C-terminal domain-like protein [Jannaschia formosa]TFL18367.1 mandelate racemase [Jannaschia formosa]